jgi:hypothetical protein
MKAPGMALFILLPQVMLAQAINNQLSYRAISSDQYFRLAYENDYFTATDNNYTQGIYVEFVSPIVRKFPLSRLLIHPKATELKNGVALEHNGYTPNSIQSEHILFGQRPFAAVLFLKRFVIATSTERKDRFSSSLSSGIIGPAAGGYEMQSGIHEWIDGIQPRGWQHQVKNDLVLNYEANYEKSMLDISEHLAVNAHIGARIGTFSDKATAGVTIMSGYFQSPFQQSLPGRKLQVYLYIHPQVDAVGYDATLQGGLLSGNNAYTISASDLSRLVLQAHGGLVLKYGKLYLEYEQRIITKEFMTGNTHRSGGIEMGLHW